VLQYEKKLQKQGFDFIIGVDEAGRGPLAGPVVAAAVILKSLDFNNRIDDSKKLTPLQRRAAFFEIKRKSIYAIASVDNLQIDRINILQATKQAMQKAVFSLLKQLTGRQRENVFIIIDGNMQFNFCLPYQSIVRGDSKSLSIAAASILAKVNRDKRMERYDRLYPQYGFATHKGYPTQMHREALRRIGPVAIHRKSFLRCLDKI